MWCESWPPNLPPAPMPLRYAVGVLLAKNVLNWLPMRVLYITLSYIPDTSVKMLQSPKSKPGVFVSSLWSSEYHHVCASIFIRTIDTQIFSFHQANYHKCRLTHKVSNKIFALVWSAFWDHERTCQQGIFPRGHWENTHIIFVTHTPITAEISQRFPQNYM